MVERGSKFLEMARRITDFEARQYMCDLVDALGQLVTPDCSYHGNEIHIPATSHADAIRRVNNARRVLGID